MTSTPQPATAPDGAVDWDSVVARSRRRYLWLIPAVGLWLGAFMVTFANGFLVIAFAVILGVAAGLLLRNARRRRGALPTQRDQLIAQYAVLHHLDPGPAHEIADRLARTSAAIRWSALLMPFLGVLQFARLGDELPPTALNSTATCLLALGFLAVAAWNWRLGRAGAHWLIDPPGPRRPSLPPTRFEGLLTGRPWKALMILSLVIYVSLLVLLVGQWLFGW